jgi:hypothetical protein
MYSMFPPKHYTTFVFLTGAALLFAEKNLSHVLTTGAQKMAYAAKWKDGFFLQRAQLAHKFTRKDKGLPARPGGSKKKKNPADDSVLPPARALSEH